MERGQEEITKGMLVAWNEHWNIIGLSPATAVVVEDDDEVGMPDDGKVIVVKTEIKQEGWLCLKDRFGTELFQDLHSPIFKITVHFLFARRLSY